MWVHAQLTLDFLWVDPSQYTTLPKGFGWLGHGVNWLSMSSHKDIQNTHAHTMYIHTHTLSSIHIVMYLLYGEEI